MTSFEKTLESKTVYDGKIIRVKLDRIELENGAVHPREVVEHTGAVCLVAMDGEQNVILVSQYRYPVRQELLEIPAGKLEAGEEPLSAAIRELEEETGCRAGQMIPLGSFFSSPGFCNERLYLYLAQDLTEGQAHPDEDEFLNVSRVPLPELLDRILDGTIQDGKTIAGVLKARAFLRAGGNA